MNTPVTHAECIQHMKELENRVCMRMKEERVEVSEAFEKIENWVIRLEEKLDWVKIGLLAVAVELAIGLIMSIVAAVFAKGLV